jgi:hypothetical protein
MDFKYSRKRFAVFKNTFHMGPTVGESSRHTMAPGTQKIADVQSRNPGATEEEFVKPQNDAAMWNKSATKKFENS